MSKQELKAEPDVTSFSNNAFNPMSTHSIDSIKQNLNQFRGGTFATGDATGASQTSFQNPITHPTYQRVNSIETVDSSQKVDGIASGQVSNSGNKDNLYADKLKLHNERLISKTTMGVASHIQIEDHLNPKQPSELL